MQWGQQGGRVREQATRWEDPQVLACKKKKNAYNKYSQAHGDVVVVVVADTCMCGIHMYTHIYVNINIHSCI